MDPKIVKIAQKCLIYNNAKEFLIILKSNNSYTDNKWDLPGGKLVIGEDHLESLKREIYEETKLEIDKFKLVAVHTVQVDDLYFFVVIYKAKTKIDEIQLSEEHSDYRWIKRDEIDKFEFNQLLAKNINKFL